jgi:hypothetical protein
VIIYRREAGASTVIHLNKTYCPASLPVIILYIAKAFVGKSGYGGSFMALKSNGFVSSVMVWDWSWKNTPFQTNDL